jgi:hypothetical protein
MARATVVMKPQLLALSVWQPYAWLLARGVKTYENRTKDTGHRGWVLIHASAHKVSRADWAAVAWFAAKQRVTLPLQLECPRAAFVGAMRIDGVVTEEYDAHGSPWFNGPYAYKIGAAVAFRTPVAGKGGFDIFPVPGPGTGLGGVQLELDILRELCAAGVARGFGYDDGTCADLAKIGGAA